MPDFNTVMAIGGDPLKDNVDRTYFNGKVYLVRIYNRVLSENEVKQNYNYDNKQININDVYFENLDITDNIYKINSLEDLKQFRDEVNSGNNFDNRYVQLNTDINLESESTWQPIGSENISFNGIFDGNGHNILNLTIDNSESYQGLFGNNAGTIENLNIKSGTIKGTSTVGAIAGQNSGTIINCSNMATVSTTSSSTGGICGLNTGNVERCGNDGIISSTGETIGGIAGRTKSGVIKFCYNYNTVTSDLYNVGGIVGYAAVTGKISSCYNNGGILSRGTTSENSAYVAGIAGYSDNVYICYCFNSVDITKEKGSGIGGICGRAAGTISYCYNTGNMIDKNGTGGYIGGIAGYTMKTGEAISYSYNIGNTISKTGEQSICVITSYKKGSVLNCYTLSTEASTSSDKKTSEEMQSDSFITLLGGSSYWYLDGGYPKLIWE